MPVFVFSPAFRLRLPSVLVPKAVFQAFELPSAVFQAFGQLLAVFQASWQRMAVSLAATLASATAVSVFWIAAELVLWGSSAWVLACEKSLPGRVLVFCVGGLRLPWRGV